MQNEQKPIEIKIENKWLRCVHNDTARYVTKRLNDRIFYDDGAISGMKADYCCFVNYREVTPEEDSALWLKYIKRQPGGFGFSSAGITGFMYSSRKRKLMEDKDMVNPSFFEKLAHGLDEYEKAIFKLGQLAPLPGISVDIDAIKNIFPPKTAKEIMDEFYKTGWLWPDPKPEPKEGWEILQMWNGKNTQTRHIYKLKSQWDGWPNNCDQMGCQPYQVKRLSDGVIITVGDESEDFKTRKIIGFKIRPINPGSSIIQQCWIDFGNDCGVDIDYFKKKQAKFLFSAIDGRVTEDTKEVYAVGRESGMQTTITDVNIIIAGHWANYIYFIHKHNADYYAAGKRKVIKPPLGIMPEILFIEGRIKELEDAAERFRTAKVDIPHEWLSEIKELYERLGKIKTDGKL